MESTTVPARSPEGSITLTNLGFLTVLHESNGYVGGYLVTNIWGRPLEFRLSSAVQPNRVQQILYAATLESYLSADLIGKTLVDKTTVPVQAIVTDREKILELRHRVDYPVVWLAPAEIAQTDGAVEVWPAQSGRGPLRCHSRFPDDAARARDLLGQLDSSFDLVEPFVRIREAIGEARKMGVHK
jgi:hypothetical protein